MAQPIAPRGASHIYAGISSRWVKAKAEVKSFEEAEAFLGNLDERKIASNVSIVRRGRNTIAVRLYQTDIITYHRDGTFEGDNGGWGTPTTSGRCNQFGPRGWFFGHGKGKLFGYHSPSQQSFKMGRGIRLAVNPGLASDAPADRPTPVGSA